MRLLQLDPDGSEELALDFHPVITIVTGLGRTGRQRLLAAIRALPRGADPGCPGLVEAHGVMLDLREETLKMLDLHSDLDVLVRSDDMPAPGSPSGPGGATNRVTVEQFLSSAPEGAYPELDQARRGQLDAREASQVLREAAERTRSELREARAGRERAAAALEHAHRAVEAPSTSGDASGGWDPGSSGEVSGRRVDLESAINELESRIDRIDRALEELSSIDTRPVQVLLDALRNPGPVDYVPSERAQELADQFVRLQEAVGELERRLEDEGRGTAGALQALDDARAELVAAERGMAKPDLSPEDVAELEAVHEEVLEAEQRASGTFGKGKRKKLDEAMAKQQVVLDRVGFPTWSAYVMGAGLLGIDPIAEQRLDQARSRVETAEIRWSQLTTAIQSDPEHRALLDQLEAVYLEAFDLLDGAEPDDLETALRNPQVPKGEVTTEELVDALAYQLELVGLDLGENPGVDRSIVVAETFLEETATITERITELRNERVAAERELVLAEQELAALPESTPAPVRPSADEPDAHAAGPEAEVPSEEELAELERQLQVAIEVERDTADTVEAREALVDAATQVEAVATSRLMRIAAELAEQEAESRPASEPAFEVAEPDDQAEAGQEAIEFYLLSRLAAHRNLSFAGSVPLVLDDVLAGAEPHHTRQLLGKLERMAEAVQIIYLSDDETAKDWAASAGFERAAVVEAPPAFAG
jgi:hypothetical protein